MMQFYETYKDDEFVSSLLRQISWTNNLMIMSAANSREEREFNLRMCIKNNTVVEYATARTISPLIVSGYATKMIDKALLERKASEIKELLG